MLMFSYLTHASRRISREAAVGNTEILCFAKYESIGTMGHVDHANQNDGGPHKYLEV